MGALYLSSPQEAPVHGGSHTQRPALHIPFREQPRALSHPAAAPQLLLVRAGSASAAGSSRAAQAAAERSEAGIRAAALRGAPAAGARETASIPVLLPLLRAADPIENSKIVVSAAAASAAGDGR